MVFIDLLLISTIKYICGVLHEKLALVNEDFDGGHVAQYQDENCVEKSTRSEEKRSQIFQCATESNCMAIR